MGKTTLLDKAGGTELANGDFKTSPGKNGLEEYFTATDIISEKQWKSTVKTNATVYLMPAKTQFKVIKVAGNMVQGQRTK